MTLVSQIKGKFAIQWLLIFLMAGWISTPITAQNFPKQPSPPKIVNDFAGILSKIEMQSLERKLVAYNDTSSTQIAVVTIKSTDGYPISEYSFQLGEKWGIGQKGMDNGILLLVASEDRDVFIATGYGLEAVVPDAIAKRIVENYIVPNFKKGDYFSGLDQATNVLIDLTTGEYTAENLPEDDPENPMVFLGIFIVFMLFMVLMSARRRGKQYHYSDRGTMIFPSSFGRSSGGGGGGGGFGGFGGGSFGGGGAGGKW